MIDDPAGNSGSGSYLSHTRSSPSARLLASYGSQNQSPSLLWTPKVPKKSNMSNKTGFPSDNLPP